MVAIKNIIVHTFICLFVSATLFGSVASASIMLVSADICADGTSCMHEENALSLDQTTSGHTTMDHEQSDECCYQLMCSGFAVLADTNGLTRDMFTTSYAQLAGAQPRGQLAESLFRPPVV